MLKLEIPNYLFEDVLEQARAEAPVECCGILAGCDGRVEKLYKMANAEHRHDHYMMSPEQQFAAIRDIRSSSLDMLAIYHSHPETPARPSAEDIRLALTPDVVYVILSLQGNNGPVVKGFQIEDGAVTRVPVRIMEDQK
ncbi:MAG: M67 family metallopeptidase [Planctomycetota bacterium]|nr:M67 family metallopeptidase [Planctomycetota bacterium]